DLMMGSTSLRRTCLSLASATGAFLRRSVGASHGYEFALFHDDPAILTNCQAQIERYLEELKLHPRKALLRRPPSPAALPRAARRTAQARWLQGTKHHCGCQSAAWPESEVVRTGLELAGIGCDRQWLTHNGHHPGGPIAMQQSRDGVYPGFCSNGRSLHLAIIPAVVITSR